MNFNNLKKNLLVISTIILSVFSVSFGQYPRNVLIEEFTSATCVPCVRAGVYLNKVLNDNKGKVFSIRYHLNIPYPGDPMHLANKDESNKIALKYNVPALPDMRVNGNITVTPTQESEVKTATANELKTTSPLNIRIKHGQNGGIIIDTVYVTAGADWTGVGTFKLYNSLVQSDLHYDKPLNNSNGEKDFQDVFVKVLPNITGEVFTIKKGETKIFSYSHTNTNQFWDVNKLYAIAFVQNEEDKQVIQCGASEIPVGSVESELASNFEMFPNPVNLKLSGKFILENNLQTDLKIYDVKGSVVFQQNDMNFLKGENNFSFNLPNLLTGEYIFVLMSKDNKIVKSVIFTKQ